MPQLLRSLRANAILIITVVAVAVWPALSLAKESLPDGFTIFPPERCSQTDERVMAYRIGDKATACLSGQEVLKLALPACKPGQILMMGTGGMFECDAIPTCANGQALTFANGAFTCAAVH